MERRIVKTEGAPQAIGPYVQGIRAGDFVFVSGQIPLDPATGEVIGGGIERQTERVLRSVASIVEASGAGIGDIVKTTVYMRDLTEFAKMNEVYAKFFGEHRPARATVEVSNLPKGARIEIDAIAVSSGGR